MSARRLDAMLGRPPSPNEHRPSQNSSSGRFSKPEIEYYHGEDYNLMDTTLHDDEVKQLCQSLASNSVRSLSLQYVLVDERSFRKIMSSLGICRSLCILNLGEGFLDSSERIQSFCECLNMNRGLASLFLCGNSMAEVSLRMLCKVVHFHPTIRTLDLANCYLDDRGIKIIATLLSGDTGKGGLEELNLGANDNVTPAGWEHFALAMANNSGLRSLQLYFNNIGDYAAGLLVVALAAVKSVVSLDMENTQITDKTAMAFINLLTGFTTHLRELNLSGNGISRKLLEIIKSQFAFHGSSHVGNQSYMKTNGFPGMMTPGVPVYLPSREIAEDRPETVPEEDEFEDSEADETSREEKAKEDALRSESLNQLRARLQTRSKPTLHDNIEEEKIETSDHEETPPTPPGNIQQQEQQVKTTEDALSPRPQSLPVSEEITPRIPTPTPSIGKPRIGTAASRSRTSPRVEEDPFTKNEEDNRTSKSAEDLQSKPLVVPIELDEPVKNSEFEKAPCLSYRSASNDSNYPLTTYLLQEEVAPVRDVPSPIALAVEDKSMPVEDETPMVREVSKESRESKKGGTVPKPSSREPSHKSIKNYEIIPRDPKDIYSADSSRWVINKSISFEETLQRKKNEDSRSSLLNDKTKSSIKSVNSQIENMEKQKSSEILHPVPPPPPLSEPSTLSIKEPSNSFLGKTSTPLLKEESAEMESNSTKIVLNSTNSTDTDFEGYNNDTVSLPERYFVSSGNKKEPQHIAFKKLSDRKNEDTQIRSPTRGSSRQSLHTILRENQVTVSDSILDQGGVREELPSEHSLFEKRIKGESREVSQESLPRSLKGILSRSSSNRQDTPHDHRDSPNRYHYASRSLDFGN